MRGIGEELKVSGGIKGEELKVSGTFFDEF